jgi:tetratricopeptide (TPR) repeat protein
MISVLAGVAIFTIIYVYKKSKKIFIALLALLFSGLVLLVVFNREKVINYLTLDVSPSGVTDSLDIRKIVWKGAVDLGLRYPIVGSGVETFAYSYFFVRPQAHNLTTEWDFLYNKAHNEYLNYFATTGFVGLFTYLFFIGAFIYYSFKILNFKKTKTETDSNQLLILSLSVAWLTILITNFFGFSTTTINLFFYLIPAIIFSTGEIDKDNKKKNKEDKINMYQRAGILSSAGLLIYIMISILNYFNADVDYGRGVYYSNQKINDYQKAAFYFDRALKTRQEHVYEDKLSYALAYLSGIASYQKDVQLAGELLQASEYYNLKSLRQSSRNVLYWKTRAKNKYLFYLVNQNKEELYEGIKALSTAARLSPTDPKIPYSLAVFYSLLYDLEPDSAVKENLKKLALKSAESSLSLKRNFDDGLTLRKELREKYGVRD